MRHYKNIQLALLSLIVAAIFIVLTMELQTEPWPVLAQMASSPTASVTLPRPTSTPTATATPTVTPTPTIDLASCNVLGCGTPPPVTPLSYLDFRLLLNTATPQRRVCPQCVPNETMNESQLNGLIQADAATMSQLRNIVLSQQAYSLAPGVVYIVFEQSHHVVIDLQQSDSYQLRNIIPPIPSSDMRRNVRITPSFCFDPNSLVITTADYHGLDGSNKTETGRAIFYHLGRAALYELGGRFSLDVVPKPGRYNLSTISWGGGPIFMWNGQYNFNPKNEWFTPANLEHYRNTVWAKITVALSQDRKYLMLSLSYGKTLAEHAQTILDLGQRWGIKMDRAMRFDGSENAYMALRIGRYVVPLLWLEEPIIVNCFAVEKK